MLHFRYHEIMQKIYISRTTFGSRKKSSLSLSLSLFSFRKNLVRLIYLSSLLLSTLFVTVSTSYAAPVSTKIGVTNTNVVKNGLIGHWTFDGKNMTNATATDISGNSRHGVLNNMTSRTNAVSGKFGQALRFSGTSSTSVAAYVPSRPQTESFWFNTSSIGTNQIILRQHTNGTSAFSVFIVGSIIRWSHSGGSNYHDTTGFTFKSNTWYHVVVTYDGTTSGTNVHIYVDGTDITLSDATETVLPSISSRELVIGETFIGKLDDVRIYNRVLSAKEVQSLYKAGGGTVIATTPGKSTVSESNNVGINSGLVGYWTFDGKNMTNATATDSSGNGYHGTLTNMTQASSKTIGKLGQALNFDGSNDGITVSNLSLGTGALTICAWIKPRTEGGGNYGRIVTTSNEAQVFAVSYQNNFEFTSNGTNILYAPVTWNVWTHACATRDATGVSSFIYKNGAVATTSSSGTPVSGGASTYIGNRNGADRAFDGRIDDVRIYNRQLSAKEVQSLYKAGGGVTIKPVASFTCGVSTVRDVDGNVYNTVSAGSQCWMKQSLRTGTRISATQTNNGIIEKHCYSNSDANCTSNNPNQPDGGLYQWNEAMQYVTTPGAKGICPTGWHIPTHDQLTTMERNICTSGSCATDFPYDTSTTGYRGTNEGTKLKPNGTSGLEVNLAGFSISGTFFFRSSDGNVWSSSESGANAWSRSVESASAQVNRDTFIKSFGFSVRCLKD